MDSCADRWRGYFRAACCRPASSYAAFLSITLVVLAFCLFFFGVAYTASHGDPVRYGPGEYFVGPIILLSFLFFVGLSPRKLDSSFAADPDEEEISSKRAQLFRVGGVVVFCLVGTFLGISLAFFRWFDKGTLPCNCTAAVVVTPTPPPKTTAAPANGSETVVHPAEYTAAYLLLWEVLLLLVAVLLAWFAVVFHEQELVQLARSRGEIVDENEGM